MLGYCGPSLGNGPERATRAADFPGLHKGGAPLPAAVALPTQVRTLGGAWVSQGWATGEWRKEKCESHDPLGVRR